VELALIVPVLLLILFGLVEVGRGLYQQHILTKAVEAGARYMGRQPQLLDTETCDRSEPVWSTTLQRAKNVVVYGSPGAGSAPLLPNMSVTAVTASPRLQEVAGVATEDLAGYPCVIRVEATAAFDPVIAPDDFLGLGKLVLKGTAEERYIGE